MEFNMDHLIQETLELGESFQFKLPLDNPENFDLFRRESSTKNFDLQEFNKLIEKPIQQGLIFYIQRGLGTFCIRGLPHHDFELGQHEFRELILKNRKDEIEFDLHFYSTDSINEANLIYQRLLNRRFPYQEELMCNVSDPGFSWWMNNLSNGFDLFFKSYGIEREKEYVRLGPMGDRKEIYRILRGPLHELYKILNVEELSISEKNLSIRVKDSSIMDSLFLELKNVFFKGELDQNGALMNWTQSNKELSQFFNEYSILRKYWLTIDSII